MKFISTVMKLVRRKRNHTGQPVSQNEVLSKELMPVEVDDGRFRCPVLWKTADGKWHRHQLQVTRSIDSTFWFSLRRFGVEEALHSSNQLMHVAHESRKSILHLIFVSGVLSLRFPGPLETQQYLAWATGSAIRPVGHIMTATIFRTADIRNRHRSVQIITKDATLVIVDTHRQHPLLFTTAQLIRAVTVSGSAIALLSAIPGNDHFLQCECAKELRNWYEQNTLKKQRQKMIARRASKPRSRVGKPRMGVLATRRQRLSEASFERIRRNF